MNTEKTFPEIESQYLKSLEIGHIYRLKRMQLGGYNYPLDYDRGFYIDVRVLEGPGPFTFGRYKVTTRKEDGKHIGSGGGWIGDSVLYVHPSDVEEAI